MNHYKSLLITIDPPLYHPKTWYIQLPSFRQVTGHASSQAPPAENPWENHGKMVVFPWDFHDFHGIDHLDPSGVIKHGGLEISLN